MWWKSEESRESYLIRDDENAEKWVDVVEKVHDVSLLEDVSAPDGFRRFLVVNSKV